MSTVRIEPLAETHRAAVLALAQDKQLGDTAALLPSESADIDRLIAQNGADPCRELTFVILDDALVVGAVTLKKLAAPDHSAELAYWIGTAHHRKSYASVGSQRALAYAFDELLVGHVHSHYLKVANVGSAKVLAKIGFKQDPNRADQPVADRFAKQFPDDHWTFVRLNRPDDIAGAARVYARRWDARMTQYCGGRASCFALVEELMGQMLQGESLRVLELGCGTGAFTARQLKIATPPRHITAVDASAKNLLIAKHVIGADSRVTFVQADLTGDDWAAGIQPESIDAVFLGWVTHEIAPAHLPNLYANIAKVLRPGGMLFNTDFMDALQPGFRSLSGDYQRRRVLADFKPYNDRFDQLPPVTEAMASQTTTPAKTNLYHSPDTHIRHLHHAGFAEAEVVWRYLGFSMVMAVK